MFKEEFKNEVKKLDIIVNDEILLKLENYFNLLTEWNKKFNLTRITEEKDVYLKHFYDSICLVKAVNLNLTSNIIDIGTGAGFPGIVLAIFFKNLKVTLVESNNKKCMFLNTVKKELKLTNIEIINERAEVFSRNNKEKYDISTCRAVSHLNTISEICIPLLKQNGLFLPLKAELNEELSESKDIINKLNAKIVDVITYNLPIENSKRTIPIIKKIGKTNEIFPRDYNKMIKDLQKKKK